MIFSIQKRFLLLLLVPVTLILLVTGIWSFIYARRHLLDEWTSSANLRLQISAHQIEMRLGNITKIMDLVEAAEYIPETKVTQAFLMQRLIDRPGVSFVHIEDPTGQGALPGLDPSTNDAATELQRNKGNRPPTVRFASMRMKGEMMHRHMMPGHMMRERPGERSGMPRGMMHGPVDVRLDEERNFLTLFKTFQAGDGRGERRLEARVAFDSFMEGILETGGWKGSYACLVDSDGTYLAHTNPAMFHAERLGGSGDPFEQRILAAIHQKDEGTVLGPGHPAERVAGFRKVPTTDWYLVLYARGDEVLAPIVDFRNNYVLGGLASLVLIGLLIRRNTKPVADNLSGITKAAVRVENGDYSVHVPAERSDEIGLLGRAFNTMVDGLRQRELLEQTFGRYVDKGIAEELLKSPEALHLGGEKKVVTMLMADLRGFTTMAEKLSPEEVIRMLNEHFGAMIEVIIRYKGIIVDFFGDSVLVFFNGISDDVSCRAHDAVTCAVEMQQRRKVLTEDRERRGLPAPDMGIGIHTGEVIVGNIGSEDRAKYGIVGSPVNEVHRIQSFADAGRVMLSEQTYELVKSSVSVGPACKACLKGLEGERDLFPVIGADSAVPTL
jgi:class 3 adenylate cyclase